MIDYMTGIDENMLNKTNIYNLNRYLLNKNFPAISTKKSISTRFVISRVRLDVDYGNLNTPMMMQDTSPPQHNEDQSKVKLYYHIYPCTHYKYKILLLYTV